MIDLSLIQDCANNSAAAQRELYNRYCGLMFGICFRYSSNKEEAEDMLQESFIRIFTNIQNFEFKGSFEGWMKKIVVNTCINFIKKNKKFTDQIHLDNIAHIEYKEESVASKLLGKQVMECLLMMPIGFRTIINLYAIEGYTHKEIAQMLEMEETTCRTRYVRGKHILEQILIKKKLIPEAQERLEWLALLNG